MQRKWRILTLAVMTLALCTSKVHSEIIRIDFSGELRYLDDREGVLGGMAEVGDAVIGSYVYTTDFTNGSGEAEHQTFIFRDPFRFTVTVGELEFRSAPGNTLLYISIGNDHRSSDVYSIDSRNNVLLNSDIPVSGIYWQLNDYTQSVFSNSALPSTAPNIERFQGNHLNVIFSYPRWGDLYLEAVVASASATIIPEPCTLVLISTGIVMLVRQRRQ